MQRYSFNSMPFSAVSLHVYIAGSHFILLCRFDGGLSGLVTARISRLLAEVSHDEAKCNEERGGSQWGSGFYG